jgi:hypothetical protein
VPRAKPQPPSASALQLFSGTRAQGAQFAQPPGQSDDYYAFLSKVDIDARTQLWDLLLEVVNKQWLDNALSQPLDVSAPMPHMPALLFHAPKLTQDLLLKTLGVVDIDNVAEGSWYLVTLTKSSGDLEDPSRFTGDLFDPDIDKLPQQE